jgi:hypothetical protein
MLRSSGLIGHDYRMVQWCAVSCMRRDWMKEIGPCLALYSPGGRVTSRSREGVLAEYI